MGRRQVTVILPCAGKGSRLGLPFAKELAPVGPGRLVIDSCLDLIRDASAAADVRVLLMTDGCREATARHVREYLAVLPVAEVVQDRAARDWPDAVLRLEAWLSPHANVLLMPDAIYTRTGDPAGEVAAGAAAHGFAFGAVKAGSGEIETAGALRTGGGRVQAYEDKPADPDGYDALWAILGFSGGTYGLDGLRLIADSTARRTLGPVTHPVLSAAPVTWLDGYADCGTWERYAARFGTAP